MKKLLILILVLVTVPTATAQISLKVCQADGETPFDCNDDVMVGTRLTLIVSSDSNDYWNGGLFITGEDRALGALAAREKDPNRRDWTGSHYENAGDFAAVWAWNDSSKWGFDLYTFYPVDGNSQDSSTIPGDWFIIDYCPHDVGDCTLTFYDYDVSWTEPNSYVTFHHVPTRDLNADDSVNFGDFALFASQWSAADCNDPNWCEGADLDRDADVDCNDLALFVEYWLWPSSFAPPGEEPNSPPDPNIVYSIVDANGSSEITIDVNDSITLYVDMATNDVNIYAFDLEVTISDTNLASIDNTEYPSGTAQILATPRDPNFDYWGPGLEQQEGIDLVGASGSSPMADGHLASFVFTCQGEGDVTLELINWDSSTAPTLQSIVIHQNDPNSQPMMTGGTETSLFGTQESSLFEPADIDEIVDWLKEIWFEYEEIREIYTKEEWKEFVESVKDSLDWL